MAYARRSTAVRAPAALAVVLLLTNAGCSAEPLTTTASESLAVVDYIDRYGLYAQGSEWASARDAARQQLTNAHSQSEVNAILAHLINAGGGRHSRLVPAGQPGDGGAASGTRPSVTRDGGITVVTVPGDDGRSEDQLVSDARRLAADIESERGRACCWIVDLRGETGGSIPDTLIALTDLLPDGPAILMKDRAGTVQTSYDVNGSQVEADPWPAPLAPSASPVGRLTFGVGEHAASKITAPIAVLQGESTASAGEALVVAFQGLPNSRAFSASTRHAGQGSVRPSVEGQPSRRGPHPGVERLARRLALGGSRAVRIAPPLS